jgi:hypothetical protein
MTKKRLTPEEKTFLREQYDAIRKVDLTGYAGMIGESFSTHIDRLSKIIGDAHEPSLGSYKERLLAEAIRNFIPKKYSIGTGFVLFPTRTDEEASVSGKKSTKKKSATKKSSKKADSTTSASLPQTNIFNARGIEISNQLDIIVYDDSLYPLLLKEDDFVIVRPESVRAIIEVKGFLNINKSKEFMELFTDFGEKWRKCEEYYRRTGYVLSMKRPGLFLMCWNIAVNTNGLPLGDGERLRKRIVSWYKSKPRSTFEGYNFPILNKAFIYNNCCVGNTIYHSVEGEISFGYQTTQGKFIVPDAEGNPVLAGDKTIASLVAAIHTYLDVPFNPLFSYFDKTSRIDIIPHKFQGYEKWLSGEDIKLVIDPTKSFTSGD